MPNLKTILRIFADTVIAAFCYLWIFTPLWPALTALLWIGADTPEMIQAGAVWAECPAANGFDDPYAIGLLIALALYLSGRFRAMAWSLGRSKGQTIFIILVLIACILFGADIAFYNPRLGDFWNALPIFALNTALLSFIVTLWRWLGPRRTPQTPAALLCSSMALIWAWGWLVYSMALSVGATTGAEVDWRGSLCALGMFVMNIDGNVFDSIKALPVMRAAIAGLTVAATASTFLLLVALFVSRLKQYLRLKSLRIRPDNNHLYIFYGLSQASSALARDINKRDPKANIVFVVDSLASNSESATDGMGAIGNAFTHRRETFEAIEAIPGAYLAVANMPVAQLPDALGSIWERLGLRPVGKLLEQLGHADSKDNRSKLYLFLLGPDRQDNVKVATKFAHDSSMDAKEYETTIFYSARADSISRVLEESLPKANLTLKLIDDSRLSIDWLRMNVEHHPVNMIELSPDNPGTTASDFTTLIVGFGETGQDALRFLYEFSAFVDSRSDDKETKRSPFYAYAIDKEMDDIAGQFRASAPAVFPPNSGGAEHIKLLKDTPGSQEYYSLLEKIAPTLNYAVVAIGDSERNMDCGIELLKLCMRKRASLKGLRVYVRLYGESNTALLQSIADHYNMLLGASAPADRVLVPFGSMADIYSYDLIINDRLQRQAIDYYQTYREGQKPGWESDNGDWKQRRLTLMGYYRKLKPDELTHEYDKSKDGNVRFIINPPEESSPTWKNMSKLRRSESQDLANALHAATKLRLLKRTLAQQKMGDVQDFATKFLKNLDSRRCGDLYHGGKVAYDDLAPDSPEMKLMTTLAKTEHLRWNAAHEMMGYSPYGETKAHGCNEFTKLHNCLIPWEGLDEESLASVYVPTADEPACYAYNPDFKLFDYLVVETTLRLYLAGLPAGEAKMKSEK
ncbi:MAG: hypothetical protein LIP03_15420 [Bacteroidales bacterium]|nr:hypothetical protein [Bacteroidales bacterium]